MATPHVLTSPADTSAHERDGYRTQRVLMQTKFAWGQGEMPAGVMVVRGNETAGVDYNAPVGTHDSSAHAEMRMLRQTAEKLGNYCLPDCEVFVTLEPRVMYTGAMLRARVARVVYDTPDPRTGAMDNILDLFAGVRLNH